MQDMSHVRFRCQLVSRVTFSHHVWPMHCVNQHASSFFFSACLSLRSEQQHLKVTTCVAKPVHTSRKVIAYASVTPCIMHRVCRAVVCFCKYKSCGRFRDMLYMGTTFCGYTAKIAGCIYSTYIHSYTRRSANHKKIASHFVAPVMCYVVTVTFNVCHDCRVPEDLCTH